MRKIPKGLMNVLSVEFSSDQIEEDRKRLEWIMRVRDRGKDCQVVLDELGLDLSQNSYRNYKSKLDLYGVRGLIPKTVPRWKFTPEVRYRVMKRCVYPKLNRSHFCSVLVLEQKHRSR